MADVTLTYKGSTIGEMSASGTKTLQTAGKYCEDDIGVEYVKPAGSGDGWTRPAEWPNLDLIDMTDFEGVYFTYDNRENDGYYWAGFYATTGSGNYTVERGTLENGVFTAVETHSVQSGQTYIEDIGVDWGDFIVYRVTASGHLITLGMAQQFITTNEPCKQHCVERYGRLPYLTSFPYSTNSYVWGCAYVEHDKLYDLTSLTSLANIYNRSYALRLLELPNFSFNGELTATNFLNVFSQTGLPVLDLREWGFPAGTGSQNSVAPLSAKKIVLPLGFAVTFDWYPPTSTLEYLDMRNCTMTHFPRLNSSFSLKYLNMSGCDVSALNGTYLFGLQSLVDFYPPSGLHNQINMAGSPLSRESLLRLLNALDNVDTTTNLALRQANLRKLTAEEIAIATEKGWTVT